MEINKIGIWTAILSFIVGTSFFLLYFFTGSFIIVFTAYFFILFAGLFNLGILLTLIFKSITDRGNMKKYLKTSGIMILNLPVVAMYIYFVMILLNTMRIEFINETGKPITEIKILGCEPKTIDKLNINENQTSWIRIKGDCSIRIEYIIDGKKKTEYVFDYVTSSMGQKSTYRISNKLTDKSF